ncbi:MFS transporter [Aquincola sp. MAHUQ-54]|uniref:MFS transporter n=1 Tax=Aquincola agrisoli TaxID=3119538 RepID=A0AAW9QNZ4_9BURK
MPEATASGPAAAATDGVSIQRLLAALIAGQIGLHSAMAGIRLAAPLQVLHEGQSVAGVGALMALFALAPVLLALQAGRMADRRGYHPPMHIAVAMTALGALLAVASTWLDAGPRFAVLCVAAVLGGGGANIGLITIQRTAGRSARSTVERMRVFSWLGLAPALSNVVGATSAGLLIDAVGFRGAYVFLLLLPLAAGLCARYVPREVPEPPAAVPGRRRTAWDLLATPGMRSLLVVNWLMSACWDVHSFAVPVLGHERGFSASVIGLILGVFPLAVTGVRLLIPLLAARLQAAQVLRGAMLCTALMFAVYPLVSSPWLMGGCAVLLGLALGSVQPMIMSTLHHLTPHDRHGEAIALRSMTINAASTLMPLLFGAAGAAMGVAPVFWVMGAAVAAGSQITRRLRGLG